MKTLTTRFGLCLALCLAFGLSAVADDAAKEVAAKKEADPSGTWRWENETQGQTIQSVLKLTWDDKKLTGTYKGMQGPFDIKNAKRDKDNVSFDFDVTFGDRTITIAFDGKVEEEKIEGTVSMGADGESREFPWTAKRSLKEEDVVGEWNIAIETPDGNTLRPTINLSMDKEKKALAGKYSTANDEYQLDVSDVKVKDHELHFTVSGDINGNSISAKYSVKPRGDKLAGKIDVDFNGETGELKVTGKRKTKKKDKEADKE